jgi:hypothetical protein
MNSDLTKTNKEISNAKKEFEDQINKEKEERLQLKLQMEI